MSPQHFSEIESGKRGPRLSSIERMAEARGIHSPLDHGVPNTQNFEQAGSQVQPSDQHLNANSKSSGVDACDLLKLLGRASRCLSEPGLQHQHGPKRALVVASTAEMLLPSTAYACNVHQARMTQTRYVQ